VLRDISAVTRMQRESAALQRVTRVMAEERDLTAAMRAAADAVRAALGYARGGIWTLDQNGQELVARVTFDVPTESRVPIDRGVLGRVARSGQPVWLADVTRDADYIAVDDAVRSEVCVPILHDGRLVGVVDIQGDEQQPVGELDLAFAGALAAALASSIERARLYKEIERQARTDAVTGLPTRQTFQQELTRAVAEAGEQRVSLLIVGTDRFKTINDTYGDLTADDVLRQIGQALGARVRPGHFLARYTADGFAVLLPNCPREEAVGIAETLRIAVAMQLFVAAEQVEQITVSIGAATYPDDAGGATELLLAANHAMHLAKQAGRNQVFQSNAALADLAPAHGRINDLLRRSPAETLALLVRAIDQRLPGRAGHADRVSRYALTLAGRLGVSAADRAGLRLAAIVHDIGMLSVPDSLLRKPGSLSHEERELLRGVPLVAEGLLSQLELPDIVLPAVVHQHERWDGSGYPDGLSGEAIPLGARIIAVADALDALTSPRAHREPLPLEQAIALLRRAAGSHFDPTVVEAAATISREDISVTHDPGLMEALTAPFNLAPADLTRPLPMPA
jgi:diguanylate cyclase (GGDEF)-like protein